MLSNELRFTDSQKALLSGGNVKKHGLNELSDLFKSFIMAIGIDFLMRSG